MPVWNKPNKQPHHRFHSNSNSMNNVTNNYFTGNGNSSGGGGNGGMNNSNPDGVGSSSSSHGHSHSHSTSPSPYTNNSTNNNSPYTNNRRNNSFNNNGNGNGNGNSNNQQYHPRNSGYHNHHNANHYNNNHYNSYGNSYHTNRHHHRPNFNHSRHNSYNKNFSNSNISNLSNTNVSNSTNNNDNVNTYKNNSNDFANNSSRDLNHGHSMNNSNKISPRVNSNSSNSNNNLSHSTIQAHVPPPEHESKHLPALPSKNPKFINLETQQQQQRKHTNSVEEGEISFPTTNASSYNSNNKTIGISKFTPPPSSTQTSLFSRINNNNNHREEGEISISKSTNNINNNSSASGNSKTPIWIPPPGASSSTTTNFKSGGVGSSNNSSSGGINSGLGSGSGIGGESNNNNISTSTLNNNNNTAIGGINNNKNNDNTNNNMATESNHSNMMLHRRKNWSSNSYTMNSNNNNNWNANRDRDNSYNNSDNDNFNSINSSGGYHQNSHHHHNNHNHHHSNKHYHHSKWDKPNFKKRFSLDSSSSYGNSGGGGDNRMSHNNDVGTGGTNSVGGAPSWRRSNSMNNTSSSSNQHNSSTIGVDGNDVMTAKEGHSSVDNGLIRDKNSHNVSSSATQNGGGGGGGDDNYYGPNAGSSSSNNNTTMSSYNNSTWTKKFQPPPGKEKSFHFTSPTPRIVPTLSNNTSSHHDSNNATIHQSNHNYRELKRTVSSDSRKPISSSMTSTSSMGSPGMINRSMSLPSSSDYNINRKTSFNDTTTTDVTTTTSSDNNNNSSNSRWKPAASVTSTSNNVDVTDSSMVNNELNRSKPTFISDVQTKQSSASHYIKSDSSSRTPIKDLTSYNASSMSKKEAYVGSLDSVTTATPGKKSAIVGGNDGTQQNPTSSEISTITIPKLTCTSLGKEENITKARKLIRTLSGLVSDDNAISALSDDNMPLPSKQQIVCGMAELESQIDQCESESALIKKKYDKQEKEIKRRREENAKIEEDARRKREEEEARFSLLREQQAQQEFESNLESAVIEVNRKVDKEMNEEDLRLKAESDELNKAIQNIENEIKQQVQKQQEAILEKQRISMEAEAAKKTVENEKLISELEVECQRAKTELDSSEKHLSFCAKNLADSIKLEALPVRSSSQSIKQKVSSDVDEKEIPITENPFEAEISPKLQRLLSSTKDDPSDMSNLIKSIYQENREVANIAHMKALSAIPSVPDKDPMSPPGLVHEHPIDADDNGAIQRYIDDWSNLARQVTGPGNALYSEPSEAPLYQNIQEQHESVKLLVKEHIRGKKQKLHKRWVELAQEYAVRQEKYSNETKINASSFTSADVVNLPILARANNYSPESSGGRSCANPYRRARRNMPGIGGSDVVRSEYETEYFIAQLKAKENMEKRIKLGGSKLPRQVCRVEKELCVSYRDTLSSKLVVDPLEESKEQRYINPWSDIEKCIFLDRFMQHPKDFRKIASFLKNKSVHDCISFYYNSKQTIPYKRALREHLKRKKRRGDVKWEATIQAAISVGATVQPGISEDKPLIFDLPRDDMTFDTFHFHPMSREVFDVIYGDHSPFIEVSEEATKSAVVKKGSHKRKISAVGNLFILDASKRKYLKSNSETFGKISPTPISDVDDDTQKRTLVSNSSDNTEKKESVKKIPPKWSTAEKNKFYDALEKHGKKWALITEAIGTKTVMQVKNFYQANKKQINKNKSGAGTKIKRNLSEEHRPSSRASPSISIGGKDDQSIKQSVSLTGSNTEPGKVVHGFTQENMIGSQGRKAEALEQQKSLLTLSNQSQADHWNDQQQRHLALAMEIQHQQQLLEFQRQHEQERARQISQLQQQQMQNLLNHHQNQQHMISNLNSIPWVAAQQIAQAAMRHEVTRHQHQRSLQDYLDGGSSNHNLNMAMALRQHQQNNYQLGRSSGGSGDNDSSQTQQQQTSDLSILAQMAADANRNLDSSNH